MARSVSTRRPCPICGGEQASVLKRFQYALFDDLDISGKKVLGGCAACGMLYDDVPFSSVDLERYYCVNQHYAASQVGGAGGSASDDQARYDRILTALSAGKDGLILDYGCGQGGFVRRCRELGRQAVGVDVSEASRGETEDLFPSLQAVLDRYPEMPVSAVVLSHVVEHLFAPVDTLRELLHAAPDAVFYIEVPDAEVILDADPIRWHELYFEHLNHFRVEDLKNLAAVVGLQAEVVKRIPFSPAQPDNRCLCLAGRSGREEPVKLRRPDFLPAIPEEWPWETISLDACPMALWGVSQYAMLILGTHPGVRGQRMRLFDGSPAKIGRSIQGVRVEPSSALRSLSEDTTLLIPRSASLKGMLSLLPESGFRGRVAVL